MTSRIAPTPFAVRFDLRLPLVQAPMVGATTPALVAAASNAGALGSLAARRSRPTGSPPRSPRCARRRAVRSP